MMLQAPVAQSCTGSNLHSQRPQEEPPAHVIPARQSVSACLLWFVALTERKPSFLPSQMVLLRNPPALAATLTIKLL